jgi:C4-dicarboxylate transporter DctM subunit
MVNEKIKRPFFTRVEDYLAIVILSLMTILLLWDSIARKVFNTDINFSVIIHHLVLWIAMVGLMITSREKRHLSMATSLDLIKEPAKGWLKAVIDCLSIVVSTALSFASLSYILGSFEPGQNVFLVPIPYVCIILPIGFLVIMVRFILSIEKGIKRWIFATLGILLGLLFGLESLLKSVTFVVSFFTGSQSSIIDKLNTFLSTSTQTLFPLSESAALVLIVLLIVSAFIGTPIFIVLSGVTLFLFFRSNGHIEVIPDEAYSILTGDLIPAIPLFTLAGFILSESKANERLVNLFKALFGWVPGGHVITCVLICAVFTTLTGGSGVTILVVGALLSYILEKSGYSDRFSQGLLTASGSTGLHFPPSLPLIMYGIVAQMNIKELFIGGLIPGILLIIALSVYGVFFAIKHKLPKTKFSFREAGLRIKESIWEILFPVVVIASYFTGLTTLVETSAIAVLYTAFVAVVIKKDIRIRDLSVAFKKCAPILGGVLIIIACANGLKSFLVDAEIPLNLTKWMIEHVHSKYMFLLLLNIGLLIIGSLIEIYSAILVIVTLIIPLGAAYGVHPVHLAIIFIANLELGYLTPPVGINLFLASYRFEVKLSTIYRSVLPFFIIMLVAVLLITYVPWFTEFLLSVIKLN